MGAVIAAEQTGSDADQMGTIILYTPQPVLVPI